MKRIESDAELQRLRAIGTGLIYNDFSGTGPSGSEYNILHATNCHWLHHANLNVPKIHFYSLTEARTWLEAHRGLEGNNWKRCGTCQAQP